MYDLSNIPAYKWILGFIYLILYYYWPWVAGTVLVLVLWRIKIPFKNKLLIAGTAVVLFAAGKTVYHFFPGYVPGCTESSNRGEYGMPDYNIISQKGGKCFFPYNVTTMEPIRKIFPVPVKDAVGTIDFDNAITIIKFRGDTIPDYDIVAKDFLSEVTGDFDFGFCPVYDEETIIYTQTRWAVVANIKTGKVESPILTMSLDEIIGGIVSIDTAKKLFVINKRIPAKEGSRQKLNIMQLDKDIFIGRGEIDAGGDFPFAQPWIVHDSKIITCDSAANRLLCHDTDLKRTTHPFVEIFNRNSGRFRRLKEMIIHPTLPFGLVVEIGKDWDFEKVKDLPMEIFDKLAEQREIHALYLIRWDIADTDKQYIPIHNDTFSLLTPLVAKKYGHFTFSPDGKWLVFGHEDMSKDEWGNFYGGKYQPFFVALPVDEKKPNFFGEPIFMGRTSIKGNDVTTTAWATDPTAFVAADGLGLYKWDLGKLYAARTLTTPDSLFPLE